LFKYPEKFPLAMTMAVYGYHYRKIAARVWTLIVLLFIWFVTGGLLSYVGWS
jgi:hypothetical protein